MFLLKKSGGDNISKKKVAADGLTRIYLPDSCLSLKQRANIVPKPNEKGFRVSNSLYMNRLIVASGEFNQVTRQWKSMVCIFWKTETQKLHPINDLPGIFGTESEAVAFALKAGKGWIDTQPAVKDFGKNNDR